MADIAGDGPPNKRMKIASPALTPSGSESGKLMSTSDSRQKESNALSFKKDNETWSLDKDQYDIFSTLPNPDFCTVSLPQQVHGMPNDGNNMLQGMGISQSNMVGAVNNPQMSRQTLDHAGLMQNNPQQMMKDFDLCNKCYQRDGHVHKMDRLGFDLDDGSSAGDKQDPQENRQQSIQRCIQSLVHACQCRDANCRLPSCHKMKRVVAHTKTCRKKTNSDCRICKQLIALCCYHAKHCNENKCQVPFCLQIKQKIRQQQLQQRLQQTPMMRRRMLTMQRTQSSAPAPSPANPVGTQPIPSGKPAGGPPAAAMQAALEAQEAAQRQAGSNMGKPQMAGVGTMPPPKAGMKPVSTGAGLPQTTMQQQWPQQQPQQQGQPIAPPQAQPQMAQTTMQQNFPQSQPNVSQMRSMPAMPQRMPTPNQNMVNMNNVDMNPGMNANRPMLPRATGQGGPPNEAVEQLMRTLKAPTSHQQQQQVIQILKSYPQLMAAFIKQRNPSGGVNPAGMNRPNNPQMPGMPNLQQQNQSFPTQEMIWQQQQRLRMQQAQQQQAQQQQIGGQQHMGQFPNQQFNSIQQQRTQLAYGQQRFQGGQHAAVSEPQPTHDAAGPATSGSDKTTDGRRTAGQSPNAFATNC